MRLYHGSILMGRVQRVETVCQNCGKTYIKGLSGALRCPSCVGAAIRQRNKAFVAAVKQQFPCMVCGLDDPIVLQFHHVDPATKWRQGGKRAGTPQEKCGVAGLM